MYTVLPRTNHLPASPLFEIKLFHLTVFSSTFFFNLMHLYYSLSQSFSSFQFLNSSEIVYWATFERLRDCAYYLFYLMHLYYSLSQSFSSFQFLNSSEIVYWAMSERLYVIVLTLTQQ